MRMTILMGFSKHIKGSNMKIICYRAKCGDAYHIKYEGDSGTTRNIFLDMGFSKTYSSILKDVLLSLLASSQKIDVLFLSHIHNDHIGGTLSLIKDIQNNVLPKDCVGCWIYNVPRKYKVDKVVEIEEGELCGIVTADKVYEHILLNSTDSVSDIIVGESFLFDGMKVIILSPDKAKLENLRNKYSNNIPLCRNEMDEISVECGSTANDYSTPLNMFDPTSFSEDCSIENASSIAALFEYANKRILWLSDSVPSVVVESLLKYGYSEINKLYCDIMLLSHHGSSSNNSLELFKMVEADKYIISSNGINKYSLPNKETIARIISSTRKIPVNIYFNYNDARLIQMFRADNPETLKKVVDIHYLKDMEEIEI